MTTEGTALQGLLQQEREALEREQAAAAENGSVETGINGGPAKETTQVCGSAGKEASQATEDQPMPDAVTA